MNYSDFYKMCQSAFSFLIEEYGFSLIHKGDDNLLWRYELANRSVGVFVFYELPDRYLGVCVRRMVDGKASFDMQTANFDGFDIRNLAEVFEPGISFPEPRGDWHDNVNERVNAILKKSAEVLRARSEILRGDLSIFPEVKRYLQRKQLAGTLPQISEEDREMIHEMLKDIKPKS